MPNNLDEIFDMQLLVSRHETANPANEYTDSKISFANELLMSANADTLLSENQGHISNISNVTDNVTKKRGTTCDSKINTEPLEIYYPNPLPVCICESIIATVRVMSLDEQKRSWFELAKWLGSYRDTAWACSIYEQLTVSWDKYHSPGEIR